MQTAFPQESLRRIGSDRLLEKAGVSIDRLPMLRVLFDRVAAGCSGNLQELSAAPVRLSVSGISVGRMGDILDSYQEGMIAGALEAPGWTSHILVGLDRAFVFTLVETLFGGDGEEAPPVTQRAFSNIETRLAQALFEHAGVALQSAFADVAATTVRFDHVVTREDFSFLGKRASLGIAAKLELEAIGRRGEMLILIPQTALSPARPNLVRDTSSPAGVRDPHWTRQFEAEVGRATVSVRAVVKGKPLTLGDIADLKVGQVLALETPSRERVKLECNDRSLFWCQLGQSGGFYTLRIERPIDQEQEFIEAILPR